MKGRPLPYCPEAHPDELQTSWIERIGLFYGGDRFDVLAVLFHAHGQPVSERFTDLDSDRNIAAFLHEWTRFPRRLLPEVLDPTTDHILGPRARLAYCPECWDDDVSAGRQPYVRSAWARWAAVHCRRHGAWLTARRPPGQSQSIIEGWVDVWRSRRTWAAAIERIPDEQFEHGARAFPSDLFHQPDYWDGFEADALAAAGAKGCCDTSRPANGSVLDTIFRPDFAKLRQAVKAELLRYPPPARLDECDVKGDRDVAPLWIANRIVCQVIAVECVRLREGRPALLPKIRRRIESVECVRTLCASCERWTA